MNLRLILAVVLFAIPGVLTSGSASTASSVTAVGEMGAVLDVIPSLYSTGVDSAGYPLPHGTVGDPHYVLTSVPSGTTDLRVLRASGGFPIPPWIADSPTSAWLRPNNAGTSDPVGFYTYRTTFDLSGFNVGTASIKGLWGADNTGIKILLNGVDTGNPGVANLASFTPFSITAGFVAGINTLDFIVENLSGGSGNPSGLRVEMTGTAVCNSIDCAPVGPGETPDPRSPISDQKAGSVLFFNIQTSNPSSPSTQNTRINLTNTHPSLPTFVHLFFVDGATCSVADSYVCLSQNQTVSFLSSNLDPGTTGYIVAVAVNRIGCPVNFNYLIGDEYVKFSTGHAANLGAEAFSALSGRMPVCDGNSNTAVLAFDDLAYNAAPRVLALDNIGARADGNDTLLVLNRFGGSLVTGPSTLSNIFGILYDDAEAASSFGFSPGTCQLRLSLSNNFPRTVPRFETVIPAGQTGWMKLYSTSDIGLLGAAINFNPNSSTAAGAFSQGHNLHKLRLSTAMTLTIPVFPPGC